MSQTGPKYFPPTPTPYVHTATGWTGWVVFAGTMFIILGGFHIIWGLAAILNDDFFMVGPSGLPLEVDYQIFGTIRLVGGIFLIIVGFGVYAAKKWARIAGIIAAGAFAVLDFIGLSSFPVWSMTTIAIQVFVIYALATHSTEVKQLGKPL